MTKSTVIESNEVITQDELSFDEWVSLVDSFNPVDSIIKRGEAIAGRYYQHRNTMKPHQAAKRFYGDCEAAWGYGQFAAKQWKCIGDNASKLVNIVNRFENDWGAIYGFTTLPDDIQRELLEEPDKISRTKINHKKLKNNRQKKQDDATEKALAALDGTVIEDIIVGDFREKSDCIPDESVDLVFIDPPYDRESIPLYEASAEVASRILKPGGHCLAYCGTYALPEILEGMGNHLKYFWMNASVYDDPSTNLARMNMTGIIVGWKPIVWYVNSTRIDTDNMINDTIILRDPKEKDHHEWQQAESEAQYYIDKLCPEDGFVVDFFCGGGTTGAVAEKLKRKWLMFEIDESTANNAMVRINDLRK